jgi:hypothetical protein
VNWGRDVVVQEETPSVSSDHMTVVNLGRDVACVGEVLKGYVEAIGGTYHHPPLVDESSAAR